MGTEQFSLCWDNFHSNMSSGLNALLKSEDLVDVTLAAEGRYIKAHKMVLSVCSPYFRELFSVNPCKHPIVFLKDVSYAALNSLLEFMYQGEVKVSQDDLGMFIKTAEALKIKGLTGDGSNSTDLDDQPEIVQPSTPVIETPSVKRPVPSVEKPQQPVRKKMLGPASKRFKSSEPLAKEPQFRSEEVDLQPSPLEPNIQFKMEPEETILDQPDAAFDTSQADDSSMDNSLVYMMESSKLDQKAGTSSTSELNDATAENQVMFKKRAHLPGNKCVYMNCGKSRYACRNLKLYRFPVTNRMRTQKWIENIGNPALYTMTPQELRRKYVCQLHFPGNCIVNYPKNRLTKDAVPYPYMYTVNRFGT